MRSFIIAVVILVVLLAGGYGAYWYKKADEFKAEAEQKIALLNEKAKKLDSADTFLRYDALNVKGFPLAMTIEIVKPVFDVPVSAMLSKLPHPAANAAPAPFTWVEEISYGDSILLSENITGNDFTFTTMGDISFKSLVNKAVRHTVVMSYASPYTCRLTVEKAGNAAPWTIQPVFTNVETFMSAFRSARCENTGTFAAKEASLGALLTSDPGYMEMSNDLIEENNHKIAFLLNSKNAKATPAFDAIVKDYLQMVYAMLGTPADQQMVITPASQYGAQNINVDVHYAGPTTHDGLMNTTSSLHFDINALDIKNDLFTADMKMHVSSVPEGDSRTIALALHANSDFLPAYDPLFAAQFTRSFSKGFLRSATTPQMQQQLSVFGPPEEIAAALMPKLSRFGKTSLDIDTSIKGPNNWNSLVRQADLSVSSFDWLSALYGIKIKGTASHNPGKPPTSDFTLSCLTCDALIADLGSYAMGIEKILDRAKPGQPPYITPDMIEGVKQFIHGIAEDGSAKDLTIHFVFNDKGFTVSGKQLPELMGLFATTIAPRLPSSQPAQPNTSGTLAPPPMMPHVPPAAPAAPRQ